MRIVTWNINSVRLRIDLLAKFCQQYHPDIICLQETKTEDISFPFQVIKDLGFDYIIYAGEKSYNGVTIISKIEITDSFSLDFYNDNKRHICAKIKDFEIHNFYVPAGGDEPDVRCQLRVARGGAHRPEAAQHRGGAGRADAGSGNPHRDGAGVRGEAAGAGRGLHAAQAGVRDCAGLAVAGAALSGGGKVRSVAAAV